MLTKTLRYALVSSLALFGNAGTSPAFPFSRSGTDIVDGSGNKMDLACVNWPGHMEVNLPEGLQHQTMQDIVDKIASSGAYNCVRLTYAVELFSKSNMTARESFEQADVDVDMTGFIDDVTQHNPNVIDMKLPEVFQKLAITLGEAGISTIMSNHISKAGWCCSEDDGNGWFNDVYFNVQEWNDSLASMAKLMIGIPSVIGLDLRNELRNSLGLSRSTQVSEFMKYTPEAIRSIQSTNPAVLTLVSGLSYDNDLKFIDEADASERAEFDSVLSEFSSKIIFEGHIYSWSPFGDVPIDGADCSSLSFDDMLGWSYKNGFPMILSEIGWNIDSYAGDDKTWINCVRDFILDHNLSHAMWLLGGDYYARDGTLNHPDSFGLLVDDWSEWKDEDVLAKNMEMKWMQSAVEEKE
ncbi:hypothetical protein TrVE_jg4912 [Triparma verrucosa]|uniref:Glycoside hydrolase family 5 domain-containing protein n=1 Tax=Triparma verrucosa TaxID=1606542 RepID=A0A9W7BVJ4_9STRA|nr:hypothetical protein TrVE_jg4912 [Triparma verrucosa]